MFPCLEFRIIFIGCRVAGVTIISLYGMMFVSFRFSKKQNLGPVVGWT